MTCYRSYALWDLDQACVARLCTATAMNVR